MSDLLTRLDAAYKSSLEIGDLWNLCEEAAQRIRELEQKCEKLREERNAVRVKVAGLAFMAVVEVQTGLAVVEQPLLLRVSQLTAALCTIQREAHDIDIYLYDVASQALETQQ